MFNELDTSSSRSFANSSLWYNSKKIVKASLRFNGFSKEGGVCVIIENPLFI